MKRNLILALCLTCLLSLLAGTSAAQAIGTPPFASLGGGPFDTVNLGNLNVHFAIPIRHKAGRGTAFTAGDLIYDSTFWVPVGVSGSQTWTPVTGANWGWKGLSVIGTDNYLVYSMTYTSGLCGQSNQYNYQDWQYGGFVYYDGTGAHRFGYTPGFIQTNGPNACPPNGPEPPTVHPIPANDGSGLTMYATPYAGYISVYLTTASGGTIYPPITTNPSGSQGNYNSIDANGNEITANNGVYTDTLGQTPLTVAGSAPSNTTLSYYAPSGATASYKVSYASYTVQTNFTCTGVSQYNATAYLVDRVTLPDLSYYQFTYETTPGYSNGQVTGRLASVKLPTGGTIAYSYDYSDGHKGIVCADGTADGFTRTLTPGGAWKYARSGSGSAWTTTTTDPNGNQTALNFAEDSSNTNSFYETERQAYTGSVSPPNLLSTTITCYNTVNPTPANCQLATVYSPINRRTVFSYLPTVRVPWSRKRTCSTRMATRAFPLRWTAMITALAVTRECS